MAREGAHIVVNDIGADEGVSRAEQVADEIRALGGQAIASCHDVASEEGARQAIAAAVDAFGNLDILVNNAGLRAGGRIDEISAEGWDRVIDSHLKASFLTIKFAVPQFRRRGRGLIINTGSEAGLGNPFNAAYAAAKEGIAGLTRSVARELGHEHIRCNLVRPRAMIDTGGGQFGRTAYAPHSAVINALGRYFLGVRGQSALHQETRPEHVAEFVTWLCTDRAAEVNGADFYVAGDEIGLFSEPRLARTVIGPGRWSVDDMDRCAHELTGDLHDRFRVAVPPSSS